MEYNLVGTGFKMLEQDRRTGQLYPLFINRFKAVSQGVWTKAENIPTRGYAVRPGWHILTDLPIAPQLLDESGQYRSRRGKYFRRVWCRVSFPMDVNYNTYLAANGLKDMKDRIPEDGFYQFKENVGTWFISGAIRIDSVLTDGDVKGILDMAGVDYNKAAREHIRSRFKVELPEDYTLYERNLIPQCCGSCQYQNIPLCSALCEYLDMYLRNEYEENDM